MGLSICYQFGNVGEAVRAGAGGALCEYLHLQTRQVEGEGVGCRAAGLRAVEYSWERG